MNFRIVWKEGAPHTLDGVEEWHIDKDYLYVLGDDSSQIIAPMSQIKFFHADINMRGHAHDDEPRESFGFRAIQDTEPYSEED